MMKIWNVNVQRSKIQEKFQNNFSHIKIHPFKKELAKMKSTLPNSASQISCCLPNFLRHSLRWLILAISLFAFTLIYANNITFNFSVICIIRPSNESNNVHYEKFTNKTTIKSSKNEYDPKGYLFFSRRRQHHFSEQFYADYTVQQRNLLFSAAALGAICCSLGITQLIGKLGSRQ